MYHGETGSPTGAASMQTSSSQEALFEAYTAAGGPVLPDKGTIAEVVQRIWDQACAAWPDLRVGPITFASALAERAIGHSDPVAALDALHSSDLLLALACVGGDQVALQCLEDKFLSRLSGELGRKGGLAVFADEAQQMLRVRLLVSQDGAPPRLAGYRGTGPLSAWLRLTLTRLALNLHQAATRDTSLDDDLIGSGESAADPEMAYMRQHYRGVVSQAMRESFEALPGEERAILRMHFLDGLSAAEVGSLFQVSGRTIQRRIAETRKQIMQSVRKRVGHHVGLNPSQLETLMRMVQSDWNLSVQRILDRDATK